MSVRSASGGFNKWSIGIDEELACVVVEASYHPNYMSLQLHDPCFQDLRKIGELFLETAELWEAKSKARAIENKRKATASR